MRRMMLASGVLVATMAVACGSQSADEAVQAAARSRTPAHTRFVAQADGVCLQFQAARQEIAELLFGGGVPAAPTLQQQATYYEKLVPVADAYLTGVAMLEPPRQARGLANAMLTDAYAGWLLLVEAVAAHDAADDVAFTSSVERIGTHDQDRRSLTDQLREYGSATCARSTTTSL